MSLALPPTLAEIRLETLSSCGLATEGNIPRNIQDVIDTRIRRAHAMLYENNSWLRTLVEREIPVEDGVSDYDIPDDTEPGKIEAVGIRRVDDGWVFRLEPGIRLGETNVLKPRLSLSYPMRYTFINQIMRVEPAPTHPYYDVLMLQYRQVPGPLMQDSERVVVDGIAIKMLAEILVKEHFGGQDTQALRQDLQGYSDSIKSDQSDGEGLQMGGHQSAYAQTQARNRFVRAGAGWANWQNWRPW